MVDEAFREITYDPEDRDLERGTTSDHCPIAVTVDPGAADDGEDDEPSDTDTTDLDLLYAPAERARGRRPLTGHP
jgi:hypothetical protein